MQSVNDKQFLLLCECDNLIPKCFADWYGEPLLKITAIIKDFRQKKIQ